MSKTRKAKKLASRNWIESDDETDAWVARNRAANRIGWMICPCHERWFPWENWTGLVKR